VREYNRKIREINLKYCKKDGDNPVVINGGYVFEGENKDLRENEVEPLRIEFKKYIEEYEDFSDNISDFLAEAEEVEIFKISFKTRPRNLTVRQLVGLMPIWKESPEEIDKMMGIEPEAKVITPEEG